LARFACGGLRRRTRGGRGGRVGSGLDAHSRIPARLLAAGGALALHDRGGAAGGSGGTFRCLPAVGRVAARTGLALRLRGALRGPGALRSLRAALGCGGAPTLGIVAVAARGFDLARLAAFVRAGVATAATALLGEGGEGGHGDRECDGEAECAGKRLVHGAAPADGPRRR